MMEPDQLSLVEDAELPLAGTAEGLALPAWCRPKRQLLATLLVLTGLLGCVVIADRIVARPFHGPTPAATVGEYAAKVPARIVWSRHPNKCWDVQYDQAGGYHNGMELQLWDCATARHKFILPVGGFGPIKLAENPDYCLDALGKSTTLWFWECKKAPRQNTMWFVPQGRKGVVQPMNNRSMCVDVPGGDVSNGRRLQQWLCAEHKSNQRFEVALPVECAWTQWSPWSVCHPRCKQMRSRHNHGKGAKVFQTDDQCDGREEQVRACTDCKANLIELDAVVNRSVVTA